MAPSRIALAGATGRLGPAVVEKLLAAGFALTILSRGAASPSAQPPVVHVDYSSLQSLTDAFRGHDAIVSLVPDHGSQPLLIDAAIAAGVRRFIPSEFGANVSGSARAAGLPVFRGKDLTQKYLKEQGEKIEWTLIVNGLFLDFALEFGFAINVRGETPTTTVFDGGDTPFSVTRRAAVGDAVVGVLRNPEQTRNRTVYVQEAAVTQNQLLGYAEKRKPGLKIERKHVTVQEVEAGAYAKLKGGKPEEIRPAMFDFILVATLDPSTGNLYAEKNDNELLGVKAISEAEVEDEVAKYL